MLYEAYVERGAPRRGVDSLTLIAGVTDPHSARAQLEELVRGGYLESATPHQRVRDGLLGAAQDIALKVIEQKIERSL
jgi:hypothetical protein